MANRYIKQFRYYGESNSSNNPSGLSKSKLVNGKAFSDCLPIVKLGIQAKPGTKFYVNNKTNSIMIGSTGIYDIDLRDKVDIGYLSFDPSTIAGSLETPLIIDIIYEKG